MQVVTSGFCSICLQPMVFLCIVVVALRDSMFGDVLHFLFDVVLISIRHLTPIFDYFPFIMVIKFGLKELDPTSELA